MTTVESARRLNPARRHSHPEGFGPVPSGSALLRLVASLLLARGFTDLVNVRGGMNGWAQAGLPIARD